ncbi:MAG TPA: polysaccharide deacetylase family protein [Candidatus Nanoarchaeia archaeon]|nr:MAG: hypothetical protein A3D92_25255 [Bacteroidetes bacterium RIFCSPHIGHO2_02_FULL_44_7]HLD03038.1 polysaccharide deacetylase family protein [Candidatus Nanoarchaeia archaeon]
MKSLLLTFDLEEFNVPKDYGIDISTKEQCRISNDGLLNLLVMLKRNNAKATFFTTLVFANNHPSSIKRLLSEGHELALHAYSHDHDYTNMPEKEAEFFIRKAKDDLERKFKTKINGFRGPQMRRPSYSLLNKIGLKYDSSLHPTFIPFLMAGYTKISNLFTGKKALNADYMTSYAKNFLKSRKIAKKDGVIVIPISVSPVARLPMFWIAFRNLPLSYTTLCSQTALLDTNYLNLYFHPWEFTGLDTPRFSKIMNLITRNTGSPCLHKLESYIHWAKNKNIQTFTISQYLKLN